MRRLWILFLLTSIALFPQGKEEVDVVSIDDPSLKAVVHPVVVLGGGIGALTSSLYLARAGLEPLVIEGAVPGGLIAQSHTVQNWPGELEIDGSTLTDRVRKQVEQNGAQFLKEEVVAIDFSKRPFKIQTRLIGSDQKRQILAETVIIAMGTTPNFLGVPGERGPDGYWGRGVTNCAICDGTLFQGQRVGVVGGGDAAVLEALYLSHIAKEVTLFVRKDHLKAVEEKRIASLLSKPNVKALYHTEVQEIKGDGEKLTHVVLRTAGSDPYLFPLEGLFLAIGSRPNSQIFQHTLQLDAKGYIALRKGQQTSIDGIYALGDIVDPVYKQAISAAGDGAKAALQAQQYLSDRTQLSFAREKEKVSSDEAGDVIEIFSQEQWEKELKESRIPVVVDFYAAWCRPCKRMAPLFAVAARHLSGKVKFLKVNVETCYELGRSYGIRSMPTLLLLDADGSVIEREVGLDQVTDLLRRLEEKKLVSPSQ